MKSNGKVRPLGFKGSNPLQAHEKNNTPPCANALTSSDFFAAASCCHVYLLSCLYVVGRHSLVLTDLRQKGVVIREKRLCDSNYVSSLVDTRSVMSAHATASPRAVLDLLRSF